MSLSAAFHLVLWAFAVLGAAAIALALMLASPVRVPPPLASIHEGAMRIDPVAPYLGYSAPTNRPAEGSGLWASPDMPRIIATLMLGRLGIDWPQSLPAIAFANAPEAKMFVTSQYSYRLLQNYTAPPDWRQSFGRAKGRISVIAGADDELMDAKAYQSALAPLGVPVTIIAHVDHMGIVTRTEAIKAIVAAMAD